MTTISINVLPTDPISHQIAKTIINEYFYQNSISANVTDDDNRQRLFNMITAILEDPYVLKVLVGALL